MRCLVSFCILVIALFLSSCSGPGLRMREVPRNGYEQTLNYQFQAQVFEDANGQCKRMIVRVRALNKIYWKKPPPDRLQLIDDDCLKPIRFEHVHYLSTEGDGLVRLSGPEVNRFWSEQFRLEDELIGWLWREAEI